MDTLVSRTGLSSFRDFLSADCPLQREVSGSARSPAPNIRPFIFLHIKAVADWFH